jgi:hypothetical protein
MILDLKSVHFLRCWLTTLKKEEWNLQIIVWYSRFYHSVMSVQRTSARNKAHVGARHGAYGTSTHPKVGNFPWSGVVEVFVDTYCARVWEIVILT